MEVKLTEEERLLQEYKLALQEEELIKQIEKEKKKFGLAFYRPHYYQHLYHAAGEYLRRMFEAGNRVGKCLSINTLVMTPKGAVPIQNIKKGDIVYNKDGKEIEVLDLVYNGIQEVWDYTNRGKVYASATKEHKWGCYETVGGTKPKFDLNNIRHKVLRGVNFKPNTPVKRTYVKSKLGNVVEPTAYTLGALLGDGCGKCNSNNYLWLSSADEKIPNKIAKELNCIVEQNKGDIGKNTRWIIRHKGWELYNKWFKDRLCHEKIIDLDVVKTWNRDSILRFVAGLIDTDGSLVKNKDGFALSFHNQSKSAIDAYAWCVLSLWQEECSVGIDDRKKYKNGGVYYATLRNPHTIKRICKELQPYLAHRYKGNTEGIENFGKRSRPEAIKLSLSNPRMEHTFDIEVDDPDHLFLLANGLVTHNSQSGCAEILAWALMERTWYKYPFVVYNRDGSVNLEHEGGENHPLVRLGIPQKPNKILVLVNDGDIIGEVFTGKDGKMWEYIPHPNSPESKDIIARCTRNQSGHIDRIEFCNDSVIQFDTFKSFVNNPQGQESKDWDYIHVDEPIPIDMWNANARGLMDRNGKASFNLTPLREPWIGELFYPEYNDPKDRPKKWTKAMDLGDGKKIEKYTWVINATIYDNPYNSEEGIKAFLLTLDPEEREAREKGIPLAFAGMIYKEFNYHKHVLQEVPTGWKSFSEPPPECCIYTTTDTHPREDYHGLLAAVDQNDNVFIFKELRTKNDSATYVESIMPYLKGRKVGWNKVEPAAWIEDSVHHDSIALDFLKKGFNIIKASKDLEGGVQKVKEILREPKGFYVSPECRGFLREIRNYSWDKKTKSSGKQKVKDGNDHFMECLYRLVYHRPKFFDYEEDDAYASVSEEVFTGSDMWDFRDEPLTLD